MHPETRIATATVTANSRSNRPTMPLINKQRDEHGDQRQADRDDREADLAGSLERRVERRQAVLDVADDVLQHDDRIVHHEADGDRQRHQRQIVEAVIEQIHHRERPGQRQRHGDGRG